VYPASCVSQIKTLYEEDWFLGRTSDDGRRTTADNN